MKIKITRKTIQFCIDSVTARVAAAYAKKKKIDKTEALRQFMATKTFHLLIDPKSYLYLESMEYTLDMWDAEQKGDWERWYLI